MSHGLLASVSDLDSTELETALRTAVEANVLVASRGGHLCLPPRAAR